MVLNHTKLDTDICKCTQIKTNANSQVMESQKGTNILNKEQNPCQEHSKEQEFVEMERT